MKENCIPSRIHLIEKIEEIIGMRNENVGNIIGKAAGADGITSEMPQQGRQCVTRWRTRGKPLKERATGKTANQRPFFFLADWEYCISPDAWRLLGQSHCGLLHSHRPLSRPVVFHHHIGQVDCRIPLLALYPLSNINSLPQRVVL